MVGLLFGGASALIASSWFEIVVVTWSEVALVLFGLLFLVGGVAALRSYREVIRGRHWGGEGGRMLPNSTFAAIAVSKAEDPVQAIEAFWGLPGFSRSDWWNKVFQELKDLDPDTLGRINDGRDSIAATELRFLAQLASVELKSGQLSDEEVRPIIDLAFETSVLPSRGISLFGDRLVKVLLKTHHGKLLRQMLPLFWGPISGVRKRAVLEAFCFDRDAAEYQLWRTEYEPDALMEKLRLELYDGHVFKTGEGAYREFRKNVLESNSDVAKPYKHLLVPLEEKLAERRNFLHSAWLPPSENPLFGSLRRALEEEKPMSFVRVGDGEAYGFEDNPLLFDERGRDRQEEHWWGQTCEASVRSREMADFRSAIQQADFLGIPTLGRLVRDGFTGHYPNSVSSRTIHAATESLRLAEQVPHQIIVDEWSKFDLMTPDVFSELIGAARACVVISGHRREILEPVFHGACPVTFLELPAHAKQHGDDFSSQVRGSTLQAIDEVSVALASGLAQPGVLVLISAGFAGKKLGPRVAASGAVAVDVGQALIRMVTRGRA